MSKTSIISHTYRRKALSFISKTKTSEFKRRGKLFVAKWEQVASILATVKEAEALYTKAPIARAKKAHKLIKNSGYPSINELIKIVEDRNILNVPRINRADIKRAYEVYGMPVEYLRQDGAQEK